MEKRSADKPSRFRRRYCVLLSLVITVTALYMYITIYEPLDLTGNERPSLVKSVMLAPIFSNFKPSQNDTNGYSSNATKGLKQGFGILGGRKFMPPPPARNQYGSLRRINTTMTDTSRTDTAVVGSDSNANNIDINKQGNANTIADSNTVVGSASNANTNDIIKQENADIISAINTVVGSASNANTNDIIKQENADIKTDTNTVIGFASNANNNEAMKQENVNNIVDSNTVFGSASNGKSNDNTIKQENSNVNTDTDTVIVSADNVKTHTKGTPKSYCQLSEYPKEFVLSLDSQTKLADGSYVFPACQEHTFILKAIGSDGKPVACDPWADFEARVLQLESLKSPVQPSSYSLYFNAVKINYLGGGIYSLVVPALGPGIYELEVLLVHDELSHKTAFSIDIFSKKIPCLDRPVKNTPLFFTLEDKGSCNMDKQTPMCGPSAPPGAGRWVTVDKCDGTVCQGEIDNLASSGRVWAPYNCHYKIFDPVSLKTCLKGKNILIIGDSISEEITNEIVQLYTKGEGTNPTLYDASHLKSKSLYVGRPYRWASWDNLTQLGFTFVLATPLGCGIECITKRTDESMDSAFTPGGKVDLLVFLTGVHDIAPINHRPKYFDVFDKYTNLLPVFLQKISRVVKPDGRMIWLNAPDSSSASRCDYLSKPRVRRINSITKNFAETYSTHEPRLQLIDYYSISENCNCGNIHKGIRFYKEDDAAKSYNGFVSRMVTNVVMTSFCQ